MKVVVDTSILIDYIRGGDKWERFIRESEEELELYLPTIVVFELFSGKSTKVPKHEQEVINFLRQFHRMELTEEIAKRAGEIYRDVSGTFGISDYLIAASALEIGGRILTFNTKHFEKIPGLSLYPL